MVASVIKRSTSHYIPSGFQVVKLKFKLQFKLQFKSQSNGSEGQLSGRLSGNQVDEYMRTRRSRVRNREQHGASPRVESDKKDATPHVPQWSPS
jgi:hypothetical protein